MPARNNDTRMVTWNGRTQSLAAWAQETGIPDATLRARLDRLKWPVERALTAKPDRRFSRSPGRPQANAPRSPPKLKKHSGGQAFARWMEGGKRHQKWFGAWGSERARAAYAEFLRAWATGVSASRPVVGSNAITSIAVLIERWLDYAKERYVKFARQTSEYHVCRAASNVVGTSFAAMSTEAFGIDQLETARREMVRKGWSRITVNRYTARIVSMFGWGVPRKLVSTEAHYALQQLEPLAPGSTTAPERVSVRSVPPEHIDAVLSGDNLHKNPERRAVLASMVRVQLLTGMRPGELCAMRSEHLDRSGPEWKYTVPAVANKNFHREKPRVVWIGPRTQQILEPLLLAAGEGTVFAFARKGRAANPRPVARLEFSRLIAQACARAGVPHWHPHQLRHNKATDVKRLYESDDAAARAIGTSEDVAARIYSDPQDVVDRRIARETS